MIIHMTTDSYSSIEVRRPLPRLFVPDKTDAMFSTGFRDTISIFSSSGEHRFLGREVKQLPDVIKSTLFSIHHNSSVVSETDDNINNTGTLFQTLYTHMYPALNTIECSVCSYNDKDIWVNESGVQSFFTKEEFWSNSNMLYLQNIINVVSQRYEKVGINVDGISLHACGNQFTNIYNKNTQYKLYEGISRMYKDYCKQDNPITKDSYMIDFVLHVEPTETSKKLKKLCDKLEPYEELPKMW